jgi:hypothetical protein
MCAGASKACNIEAHIARGNRNLLLVGITLIAVGSGLAALFSHWFPLLLLVPGVIVFGAWLRRIVNPSAHPLYQYLARLSDVQQMVQRVNEEFAGIKPGDAPQFGINWLAQGNTFGVDLVRWQDIAWLHIYTQVRNGVRSNYIRVRSRDGRQFVMPVAQQAQAEQLLRELYARAPWAEVGFSRELEQQWIKERATFLQRVDARK